MRISTANSFDTGVDTLTRRQSDLSELQEQLSSGKRLGRASDDPTAAARAERALAAIGRSETSQRAVDASRVAMTQTESSLGDATALLQRARELVVSAGNASYGDSDRLHIADEIRSLREQLLAVANQGDGAGSYLFGGQGPTQKPFVDAAGGVQYAGAPGESLTEGPTGLPLTSDGRTAWLSARTGNGVFVTSASATVADATIDVGSVSTPSALTGSDYAIEFSVAGGVTTYAVRKDGLATAVTAAAYVAGQAIVIDGMRVAVSGAPANGDAFQITPSAPTLGVFAALDEAAADLRSPGRTGSQVAQTNTFALRDIDAVLGRVQSARSSAGAVLNRIDSETDRLDGQKLAGQTERSNAEDVDLVHVISDFQNRQSSYDAALKSYAMVQRLSLFQYVNG